MLLSLSNITVVEGGIYALLGYGVVFSGLLLLMLVVTLLGKAFTAGKKHAPVAYTPEETPPAEAPGSAGSIKLHGVDPKTAAMLMAIVANKLDKPINSLRFISIKEVTE